MTFLVAMKTGDMGMVFSNVLWWFISVLLWLPLGESVVGVSGVSGGPVSIVVSSIPIVLAIIGFLMVVV